MADASQGRGHLVDVVQRMADSTDLHDMVTGGVDTSQMPRSENVQDAGFFDGPVGGHLRQGWTMTKNDVSSLFDNEPDILFPNIQAPGKIEQYADPSSQ